MKILFVRHGDPDYVHDSLTEKGKCEAALLAERLTKLSVRDFYCSPLGRAKETAEFTLKRLNRDAEILPWLREFDVWVRDPETGKNRYAWDFFPSYWTGIPELYDRNTWYKADVMQTGAVEETFKKVCDGFDALLLRYGYQRHGMYYTTEKGNEDTIVFFCHLGVQFAILSHLLGISAPVLWQGFFVAPTSVTVVATEERQKGIVSFRCKQLGDTSHLYAGDHPASNSGFFEEIYRK